MENFDFSKVESMDTPDGRLILYLFYIYAGDEEKRKEIQKRADEFFKASKQLIKLQQTLRKAK